jgi:protein O-GlcNAc transferase
MTRLETDPGGRRNDVAPLFDQALALFRGGRLAEAKRIARRILANQPKHAQALHLLGAALSQQGNHTEGLRFIDAAMQIEGQSASIYNSRGNVLVALQRFGEAVASYDKAIALKSDYAEAFCNRGAALQELKRFDEALASYDKAIALKSNSAEAFCNRGLALQELKRFDEALASYDKAIALTPDYAEAFCSRGAALQRLKRFDEALASYDKAIALKSDFADAFCNRGAALQELKCLDEALASYDRAIALKPDVAEAFYSRGIVLQDLNRFDEALASYDKAIALKPNYAEAWLGRGNVFTDLRRFDEAFAAYDQALNLKPDLKYAEGARLFAKMGVCDWAKIEAEILHFLSAVTDPKLVSLPFTLLAIPTSSADRLQAAKTFVADRVSFPALWRGEIYSHDRIRIGYFSADFRDHPVAHLAAGLFKHHDKSRFEITAISFGPDDGSDLRSSIKSASENFVDVHRMPDRAVAELIRDREIDVIVDLMGLTQDCRFSVLSRRVAPIQANFLGYPGTMGADFMDYIIADPTIIPKEHFAFYSEQVVWLPDTYLPNAYRPNENKHPLSHNERHISQRVPTRAECNLPEAAFVFCCFNGSYKITPMIFDLWMRLLRTIPGSVLWLTKPNPTAEANLGKEAELRGVSRERIIFAPKLAEMSDHLARQRHADLFLDTLPYNAHTTASDALWAGLPVLTCLGDTFAGRVAASLLKAIDLPELITHSPEEYEALAIELALNQEKLQSIREKLARNRLTTPLFDTPLYTKHLEAAYEAMYYRYQAGLPPDHIRASRADGNQPRSADLIGAVPKGA